MANRVTVCIPKLRRPSSLRKMVSDRSPWLSLKLRRKGCEGDINSLVCAIRKENLYEATNIYVDVKLLSIVVL